jgi:hypothetical protein
MEGFETIFGGIEQKVKQTDSKTQKRDKHDIIIKNQNIKLALKDKYIEIDTGLLSQTYGIFNIDKLYIHKDIYLSISDCYAISKYVKIYFIDGNGNIVAKYKRYKKL